MRNHYQLRIYKRAANPDLTRRERQILKIRARGLKREAVAIVLDIAVQTVDCHSTNAYRKLGVNCLADAIREFNKTVRAA